MAILSAQDGLLRAQEKSAASSRLCVGKATTSRAAVRSRTATTKAASKVFLRLRTVDSRLTTPALGHLRRRPYGSGDAGLGNVKGFA